MHTSAPSTVPASTWTGDGSATYTSANAAVGNAAGLIVPVRTQEIGPVVVSIRHTCTFTVDTPVLPLPFHATTSTSRDLSNRVKTPADWVCVTAMDSGSVEVSTEEPDRMY